MKETKQLNTRSRVVYYLKMLGLGMLIGGVIGFISGFLDGYGAPGEVILTRSFWSGLGSFTLIVGLLGLLYYMYQSNRLFERYQVSEDDDDEELVDQLYRTTYRHLEYAFIFFQVVSALLLFFIISSIELRSSEMGSEVTVNLWQWVYILLLVIIQIVFYRLVRKIRQYKLSIFPTIREMRDYAYSFDEGEREAKFEHAYLTIFNLNNRVLPALYIVVWGFEMISQTNQIVALLAILAIHIYINLNQYRMVRNYFK